MDPSRRMPEYTLEIFADPTYVKDMIKGDASCYYPREGRD